MDINLIIEVLDRAAESCSGCSLHKVPGSGVSNGLKPSLCSAALSNLYKDIWAHTHKKRYMGSVVG